MSNQPPQWCLAVCLELLLYCKIFRQCFCPLINRAAKLASEFNLTISKLHTYPYIFMNRYLEQKQALAEICISCYKSEMHFLMTFLYIHRTKYTINKQTYALNSQGQLYSIAVLMNTMLGLPEKPHLLNKENCCREHLHPYYQNIQM